MAHSVRSAHLLSRDTRVNTSCGVTLERVCGDSWPFLPPLPPTLVARPWLRQRWEPL